MYGGVFHNPDNDKNNNMNNNNHQDSSNKDDENNNVDFFNITTICLPTRPGWSRVIILTTESRTEKEEQATDDDAEKNAVSDGAVVVGKKSDKRSLFRNLSGIIPIWLIHQLSSGFLDSDLKFLHWQEQEREQRGGDSTTRTSNPYFMPAKADLAVNAFRQWKNAYASVLLPLPPPIQSTAVLFDRYTQHTEFCRHCQEGLETIQKIRVGTVGVVGLATVSVATMPQTPLALVGGLTVPLCLGFLLLLNRLEGNFYKGDFKHYEND